MRISDWSSDVCSSDLEGPHRTVEPKALLFKQSRAVGADSVTACAETDGRLACFLSDPVTQSDDFCALQRFGQGADIAVCSRNVFFMGRIDPGMELRPHITCILCDPLPEQRHSGFTFQHRIIDHMNRSEEHTSELQSLMRISYAVFCLKKK